MMTLPGRSASSSAPLLSAARESGPVGTGCRGRGTARRRIGPSLVRPSPRTASQKCASHHSRTSGDPRPRRPAQRPPAGWHPQNRCGHRASLRIAVVRRASRRLADASPIASAVCPRTRAGRPGASSGARRATWPQRSRVARCVPRRVQAPARPARAGSQACEGRDTSCLRLRVHRCGHCSRRSGQTSRAGAA